MSIATKLTTIGAAGASGEAYYVARFEPVCSSSSTFCYTDVVCNYRCPALGDCCSCDTPYRCFHCLSQSMVDWDYDGNVYYMVVSCNGGAADGSSFHIGKIDASGKSVYSKPYKPVCSFQGPLCNHHYAYSNPGCIEQNCGTIALMYDNFNNHIRTFYHNGGCDRCMYGCVVHYAFDASDGSCLVGSDCRFACAGRGRGICAFQYRCSCCGFVYVPNGDISLPCNYASSCGGGLVANMFQMCSDGSIKVTGNGVRYHAVGGTDEVIQGGHRAYHHYRDFIKYCGANVQTELFRRYECGVFLNSCQCGVYGLSNSSGGSKFYGITQMNYANKALCIRNTECNWCCRIGIMTGINGNHGGRRSFFTFGTCQTNVYGLPVCVKCIKYPLYLPCNCICGKMDQEKFVEDTYNVYHLTHSVDCLNGCCSCKVYITKYKHDMSGICWSTKIHVPMAYSKPCYIGAGCCAQCATCMTVGIRMDRCMNSVMLVGSYMRCHCHFADQTCFDGYGWIPFIIKFSADEPPVGQYDHFCFETHSFSLGTGCCKCHTMSQYAYVCFSRSANCSSYLHCGCTQIHCPSNCLVGCCCPRILDFQNPLPASDYVCITKV